MPRTMSRKLLASSRCAAANVGTIAVAVSRWVTYRDGMEWDEDEGALGWTRWRVMGVGVGWSGVWSATRVHTTWCSSTYRLVVLLGV